MKSLNILLAGVGGQGVILASDLIAESAMDAGYDVKKTDVHGMAQRGGSVVSHVRIGPKVLSPLIPSGQADILLGMEKLESARWANELAPDGVAIVNELSIYPVAVGIGAERYPTDDEISALLKRDNGSPLYVAATRIATELGNSKAFNVVMSGYVSAFFDIAEELWLKRLEEHVPSKVLELNKVAFARGRELGLAARNT